MKDTTNNPLCDKNCLNRGRCDKCEAESLYRSFLQEEKE